MTNSHQNAIPHRCRGRTSTLQRCERMGAWWFFCPTHREYVREWSLTVMVILLFFAWLQITQQIEDAYSLLNRGDLSAHQRKDAEAIGFYQAALTLFWG